MNFAEERAEVPGLRGPSYPPLALLLVAAACGTQLCCSRPGEARARQDREVGRADIDTLGVEVAGGLAVVQALAPDSISLWASAPRLELAVSFHTPAPEALWLEVENCMAGAALDAGAIAVADEGRDGKTCRFRVGPFGGSEQVELRLAPPGSEVAGPFRFAVMSDVQEAIDRVQDIYAVVNREPGLDFMFSAGDLTEFGTGTELERFQTELEGLDIPEMGALAYPDFAVHTPVVHGTSASEVAA